MTRISILYPNSANIHFDFEYYVGTHMPLAIKLLSQHPGFQGVSVERGVTAAGTEPAYVAMCHFLFDSAENFAAAFAPHATLLQGDIPNYTNAPLFVQVSEVLISQ